MKLPVCYGDKRQIARFHAELLRQCRAEIVNAGPLNAIANVYNRINFQKNTELHKPLPGDRISILTKKTCVIQPGSCTVRNHHQDIPFYQFTHKRYMNRTLFS